MRRLRLFTGTSLYFKNKTTSGTNVWKSIEFELQYNNVFFLCYEWNNKVTIGFKIMHLFIS